MRNYFTLLICLALGLGFSSPAYALEAPLSAEVSSEARQPLEKSVKARKKGGLFKSFQAVKALKKGILNGKKWMQNRAQNLSRTALLIFVGALFLLTFGGYFGSALVFTGLIALLVSNLISFKILATESNEKSRKIAKIILWTTLGIILLILLVLLSVDIGGSIKLFK